MVHSVISDEKHTRYITDSEIDLIEKGIENGLLRVDGNVVSLKGDEKRRYDLFTLNREYLTQFAALVALTSDYSYPLADCRFEYHMMDICVFKKEKPYIYVETKVSERGAELLLEKITGMYAPDVVSHLGEHDRGNDPLRKAKYMFQDRPEYLWLVTPRNQRAFRIDYTDKGFLLVPIDAIPSYMS